jgi:hypothetical protein
MRKLSLKLEHLADLTPEDLAGIAGAADAVSGECPTVPALECLTLQGRRCWTEV